MVNPLLLRVTGFFFLHSITLESNVKVLIIKTKTFATWSAVSAPLEISRECILMLGCQG